MGEPVSRYVIPVPEWCRTIWVSADAKALWTPRIQRIALAWSAAERASVGRFRSACRQSVSPEHLPALSLKAAEAGKTLLVLGQSAATGTYTAAPITPAAGSKWDYNVVIAESAAAAKAFNTASATGDNAMMGDLLGFPPCCIEFFSRIWVTERWLDTTWPMSLQTPGFTLNGKVMEFAGIKPQNNILLRWLGVRMVPHLPCSHTCEGTTAFGSEFMQLLQTAHPEEFGWMLSLLSARLQWSANKGIAEIATPICKTSAKTDAMAAKVVVRLMGGDLEAQARGVMFPWKITHIPPSIPPMPLQFHKAAEHDATRYLFNGFNSEQGMTESHAVIQDFYRQHFDGNKELLDLGCGNGVLAASLSNAAVGVEADPIRALAARSRISVREATIINFIRDSEAFYEVALISAERLAEMNDEDRAFALQWLQSNVEATVLYTYSDGNLEQICQRLNLAYSDLVSRSAVQVARLEQ